MASSHTKFIYPKWPNIGTVLWATVVCAPCGTVICAPCGTVVAWTKLAKSESPTNIMRPLESVYPNKEERPAYICIDKECTVLKHIVANGTFQDWCATSCFVVDSYYYTNHKATDMICRTWCNPAPTDGSAPNLVVLARDRNGNPVFQREFNTQVREIATLINQALRILNRLVKNWIHG